MRHFVLGTAGHIDHGKSALVKALTGIDPDRLKEEKLRGITIELGFAHLELDDLLVHIVDVPGHERFIRAMAAGAAGVDAVVLVVAADEGVMPQTREHLSICRLLGIRTGFVALTKVDLVDEEWLELVREDIREFVSGTFLEAAPVVACSAVSGQGLEEVRAVLRQLADQVEVRNREGICRLPVDRVFTMKGFGTVVTGTLVSGTLTLGQEVVALPEGPRATIRGLQVHGRDMEEVEPGSRVAVNLKGVDKQELQRGMVLTEPGWFEPVTVLDAMVTWLSWNRRPLERRKPAIFMAGTSQAEARLLPLETGRLEPGATGPVQIRLSAPMVLQPGDRFILQGFELSPKHGSTVGGGTVVRTAARGRRRPDPEYAAFVVQVHEAAGRDRVALELEATGLAGAQWRELACRLPNTPGEVRRHLESLVGRKRACRTEAGRYVSRPALDEAKDLVAEAVAELGRQRPLAPGFDRQEVAALLPRRMHAEVFRAAVSELLAEGRLLADQDKIAGPDQARARRLADLAGKVEALYERAGLAPPRPREAAQELGLREEEVQSAISFLVREGRLVSTRDKLFFHRRHVDELRERLVAFLEERGEIAPLEFKEMCGVTRKFTIPLAEYFDKEKLTIRVGDVRRLRR